MKTVRIADALLAGVVILASCSEPNATIAAPPPSAIVLGQLDASHAYVAGIIFDAPSPSWFPASYQPWYCSGTLLSPRVLQTAAHCMAFAAQTTGYPADALPSNLIHVSFAQNIQDPSTWRTVAGYVLHPDFVAPFSSFDVGLIFLSQPVNNIEPGKLAPAGYLDSFKNQELQASTFSEVGYGMLGAYDNFALTGDRRVAQIGYKQLDANFLYMGRDPGGPCVGDSGGPILREAGGVEYVVATLHGFQVKVNSNTKQDCNDDFATQRLDLATVLEFINANLASHGP